MNGRLTRWHSLESQPFFTNFGYRRLLIRYFGLLNIGLFRSLFFKNDLTLRVLHLTWLLMVNNLSSELKDRLLICGVLNRLRALNLWFRRNNIIARLLAIRTLILLLHIHEHLLHTHQWGGRALVLNNFTLIVRGSSWLRGWLTFSLRKGGTLMANFTDLAYLQRIALIPWCIVFSLSIQAACCLKVRLPVVSHGLHEAWGRLAESCLLPWGLSFVGLLCVRANAVI